MVSRDAQRRLYSRNKGVCFGVLHGARIGRTGRRGEGGGGKGGVGVEGEGRPLLYNVTESALPLPTTPRSRLVSPARIIMGQN